MEIKNKNFKLNEEIIDFKIEDAVTSKVRDFYELDPFPNYEINDTKSKILEIGDKNIFLKTGKHQNHASWLLLFYALWHNIHVLKAPSDGNIFECLES